MLSAQGVPLRLSGHAGQSPPGLRCLCPACRSRSACILSLSWLTSTYKAGSHTCGYPSHSFRLTAALWATLTAAQWQSPIRGKKGKPEVHKPTQQSPRAAPLTHPLHSSRNCSQQSSHITDSPLVKPNHMALADLASWTAQVCAQRAKEHTQTHTHPPQGGTRSAAHRWGESFCRVDTCRALHLGSSGAVALESQCDNRGLQEGKTTPGD